MTTLSLFGYLDFYIDTNVVKIKKMVRMRGLEPPRLAAPDPKSGVSANFTTSAQQ